MHEVANMGISVDVITVIAVIFSLFSLLEI